MSKNALVAAIDSACGKGYPKRRKNKVHFAVYGDGISNTCCGRYADDIMLTVVSEDTGDVTCKRCKVYAAFKNTREAQERWLRVAGFPYSVSNQGRVRNNWTEKMLKHQTSKRGGYYPFVNLYKYGKRKNFTVHGLVAAAFLGKRPRGHEIHHKDEDRSNPALSNLEYITIKKHGKLRRKV